MYIYIFSIVIFLSFFSPMRSQDNEYVVMTFERIRAVQKGNEVESFYWIALADSTYRKGINLYPLYLWDFSYTDLIKCSKKDTINPYLISKETSYEFSGGYENQNKELTDLIYNNRELVQVIKKQWNKKFKETVKIYATPIIGEFYICNLQSFNLIDYEGVIYLPAEEANFESYDEYWKQSNSKNVRYADYSLFFFVNTSTGGSLEKIPHWRKIN